MQSHFLKIIGNKSYNLKFIDILDWKEQLVLLAAFVTKIFVCYKTSFIKKEDLLKGGKKYGALKIERH